MSAGAQPCAAQPEPPLPTWIAPLGRDHPLLGRIYATADRTIVDPADLVVQAARADFVLLGEKHDNPDHHRLQAWTIEALVRRGRRPAIVLEMLDHDQAPALARHLAAAPRDAAGLGQAVGWAERGWPDWQIYAPIAAVALDAGLPLVAADLSRDQKRAISRHGISALPNDVRDRLMLSVSYDFAQARSLRGELRDSHCGQLPESALANMMDVQRARDASFAAAMAEQSARPGTDGAILIAGAGHVRRDRGVPWHLFRLAPGKVAIVLAFIEVDNARRSVDEYQTAPFDYAWFTPRLDDTDPCAKFADQLRRGRRP